MQFFAQDYPILPVRRRFWENTLRVLDPTGTDSQLRNQLSMIHKAIQTNLEAPLGSVIQGDYIYFDSADKLLQTRILPRKVHEKTMNWIKGNPDQQLTARACGLVFLINKLAGSNNEIGIQATIDTVADLMVEDLPQGSSALRGQLPALMDGCELLMKVGDEYRIQTEESAAWNDEFLSQRSQLANEAHRVEAERDDRIRQRFSTLVKKLTLTQGRAKVIRNFSPLFNSELPADANQKVCVWVRDGWSIDENSVRADALQAGHHSPTVYVFIPKRSADDLRHQLIDYKAASATLEKRGTFNTAEGTEARAAMETAKQSAEGKINELLEEAFSGARVLQGGGSEILGDDLQTMVLEAAGNALKRLYPQFPIADHAGWAKVYANAKKGAPDALKAVGDDGESSKNPVVKELLKHIGGGKKGAVVRGHFESPPFGWSRDAVDGGLQVLLVAGLVRAQDDHGKAIDFKSLDRKAIGKTMFKVESATITTAQRIQVRKLFQKNGISAKPGEELAHAPRFLEKLLELAQNAGGDAPQPAKPATATLEEIRLTAGNEQLLALYNRREELAEAINQWSDLAKQIQTRWTAWIALKQLAGYGSGIVDAEITAQVANIEKQRQLLAEPDLILPLVNTLAQTLREELKRLADLYNSRHEEGMARLKGDGNWQQLDPEQRNSLLAEQNLTLAHAPRIEVATTDDVIATLKQVSISALGDRMAALPSRFDAVLVGAAELMESEAQFVKLPSCTIKTEEDIDGWLKDARTQIQNALQLGPVIIH